MADFEPSTYSIMWSDPNRATWEPIMVGDSKVSDLGKDDIRLLQAVPFRPTERIFKEYDYLDVWLMVVGADTVVTADSYIRIPVTFKNERTGFKWDDFITGGLVAGERVVSDNPAGLVYGAGDKKMAWYYRIPAGLSMVLGHRLGFNSRIVVAPYDDT